MLIAASVDRDFQHTAPVNQILLGTTSAGTSYCKGQVTCAVEDNPVGASILCCIEGTVDSKTCGTNGPALIRSTTITKYQANKRLTFNGKAFACEPTTLTCCTRLEIAGIESSLPRLRGRLVIRIATARAEQSKAQVEAIINSQTEQELRQRIDADFHLRIAELNAQFASRLSILKYVPGGQKQLHLRSWNDGVELSIGHSPRQDIEHLKNRPAIGKSVEVWLRRNDNLVANETMTAILLSKAPAWLSTYFSENPLFLSPDEHKWGIEFGEKWVVLKLP